MAARVLAPRPIQPASGEASQATSDTIILSVKLASGDFETSLKVQLPATNAEMERATKRWLALAFTALEMSVEHMKVQLAKDEPIAAQSEGAAP